MTGVSCEGDYNGLAHPDQISSGHRAVCRIDSSLDRIVVAECRLGGGLRGCQGLVGKGARRNGSGLFGKVRVERCGLC